MRPLMKYLWMPIVLVLLSCTNNPDVKDDDAKAAESLVGVWRGEGTYSDEEDSGWTEAWKMVRGSDGTYKVDYMIVHDGDKLYEQSSDAGTWSYENGVYFEINSNDNKVTYDVFVVKKDRFEYNIAERKGTVNIEETKTVADFQLQDPPEGYSYITYDAPAEVAVEEVMDSSAAIDTSVDKIEEKATKITSEITNEIKNEVKEVTNGTE